MSCTNVERHELAPTTLRCAVSADENRFLNRHHQNQSSFDGFEMTPQHHSNRTSNSYLQHRYDHPPNDNERRQKITINVSGERYQTYVETLNQFPDTLLGSNVKREEFYDDVEDEYFFDRDRSAFNAILYYYQSKGQLYCPLTVPMTILVTEAKFFELGNDALKQVLDLQLKDKSKEMPANVWKRKIWCLFEHPETSRAARLLTIFSVFMIIVSVIILCVETLPFAKNHTHSVDPNHSNPILLKNQTLNKSQSFQLDITYENYNLINVTGDSMIRASSKNTLITVKCTCAGKFLSKMKTVPTGDAEETKENAPISWHQIFLTSEIVFITWFTFELLVRFTTCPNKKEFLMAFLNIIDIVSVVPFYVTTLADRHTDLKFENFRVIRLVRVFRIFKLSRHSKGLQILGKTLRASMRELGLLIFFLAIGVILFSSTVYYLEDENFTSIPDAFWWAIITMCTVGYGDKVPITFFGKVVGSACSVCGVLSIALPVPVIVSNFDYFYNREKTRKMHEGFIEDDEEDKVETAEQRNPANDQEFSEIKHQDYSNHQSPLLSHRGTLVSNGSIRSVKSPIESRKEEISRQAIIKGLERRSRKISQRISETSLFSPAARNNGNMFNY